MLKPLHPIVLCAAFTLVTLPSAVLAADTSKVLATVDGHKITQDMFDRYQRRRNLPQNMNPQQQKEVLLTELVNRQLIVQDAEAKKLHKAEDVKVEIEEQRLNILASAMLKKTASNTKVTDKQLHSAYDKYIKELGNVEFKARHILLSTEKDAKDVIAELNKGGDFAKLAETKSVGPSASSGGDLGWFQPTQMVKPFSDAVGKMKKGDISKTPVNTQFGWHVIKLEDTRKLPPPAFEDIKSQLEMRMQSQIIEGYIDSLRKKAKISMK